ncbi:MAG TPA: sugar ABC transporter permease [Micromonosporaceae bacterium]|nr:sugar ABC transporter permease [Micromonosporaceae bacterium]
MTAPTQTRPPAPRRRPGQAREGAHRQAAGARRRRAGIVRLAALLLSPTLLALALVVGYPVLAALRLSLTVTEEGINPETGLIERSSELGTKNYTDGFQGDTGDRFLNALWNTTTFTLATGALVTVIGVVMALIMSRAFRGRGLVRAAVLVPWAIPTVISALLWKWIFSTDGVANDILNTKILWTTEGFQAWLAVVIADTWKTAPFIGLLVLAGLQLIPAEVYEAARVDGSSAWRTFWRITLPLVKPALVVAVLFRILDLLRMFDLPFVLVGPRKESVETLSVLAWDEMSNLRFGPAAAYAMILFVYIAIVAYVFVRVLGADIIGRGVQGRK